MLPTGPYRLLGWSFGGLVDMKLQVELLALLAPAPADADWAEVLPDLLGEGADVAGVLAEHPARPDDQALAALVIRQNPAPARIELDRSAPPRMRSRATSN